LKKSLYGLKKPLESWYSRLDKYLQEQGFKKGNVDSNIYVKVDRNNILIIEVYVDDIIFGSDDDMMSKKFSQDMQNEFEMSLLGLHIYQQDKGIFISQTKYIK
jgi:hypothetical protein